MNIGLSLREAYLGPHFVQFSHQCFFLPALTFIAAASRTEHVTVTTESVTLLTAKENEVLDTYLWIKVYKNYISNQVPGKNVLF